MKHFEETAAVVYKDYADINLHDPFANVSRTIEILRDFVFGPSGFPQPTKLNEENLRVTIKMPCAIDLGNKWTIRCTNNHFFTIQHGEGDWEHSEIKEIPEYVFNEKTGEFENK